MLKGILDRLGKKEQPAEGPAVASRDGWVELVAGRLVVHDPAEDGRYATITPSGCVRLFVNEEEVREATAVTASDKIRYEVLNDPVQFFQLTVAPDGMSVTLLLTADPYKVPDTVVVDGRYQVRLLHDYSPRARNRPFVPKQLILEHLMRQGIVFGVDETAVQDEVSSPTWRPVVIARGQEARPPVQGRWEWRLGELSLAEAGQVIAEYDGEEPNLPRITVLGERTSVYEDLPQPPGYLAGNGTRIVQPGRLVASASGRARAVPAPQGHRVHIFPVHKVDGDLSGELQVSADLIVTGSVHGARVTSTGEILVLGGVHGSTLEADTINILGAAVESTLITMPAGHCAPLRAELAWVGEKLKAMRSALHNHQPITEEIFREVSGFVRGVRRRAEQLQVQSPEFAAISEDLAKVFMGTQTWTAIDLGVLGRLLTGLEKVLKAADQMAAGARDVRARSLERATVWAGRDLAIEERIHASTICTGGGVRIRDSGVLSQVDLLAGGPVRLGTLSTSRGSTPVTIRGTADVEVAEAQMGSVFEFGAERRVFERDQYRIGVSVNAKGQLLFKQRPTE